jgi:hypothetical protein
LHTLNSNFRELYHAVKFPSKDPFPLVANYICTRVYDSRFALGRLWRQLYKLSDCSISQDRLKKAVYHTNALFQQEAAQIRQPLNHYLKYLEKRGKGYILEEADFFQTRNLITQWNASTKPFLKMLEDPTLRQKFYQSTGINPPTPLFYSAFNHDLSSCQKCIDLEGLTKGPLPVQVFKKIIRELPLNVIDQKDLEKWIIKIDYHQIEAKIVHKALKFLSSFYAKKNAEEKDIHQSLINMELFLEDKGCKVFKQEDQKHLKWRQSLKKGTTIPLNDSTITLGNEIFPSLSGSDQTRAYAIEDQPDKIALIAQNRTLLPLRDQRMRTDNHPYIEPALFSTISSDGQIAIVENLKPLNSLEWTCPNGSLSPEETAIVNSLGLFIQKLTAQNFTPLNFSSSSLMFNKKWELRLIKPMLKGNFDFNAIEDFIADCAGGNPVVFKELMKKSGLVNHAITKYYRDVVSNTLKGDTIAPDDLAGIHKIGDPKVVDRAVLMIGEVKEKKNQLLLKLRRSSPNMPPDQLNSQANKMMLDTYLQGNTISKIL